MVKKRWYDNDPTLSMAVSLLQNASKTNQVKATTHILRLLEDEDVFHQYKDQVGNPLLVSYIFPFVRRKNMDQTSWRLLEILKHLPKDIQLEMSLNLIHYIYMLDAGGEIEETETEISKQANA